jgi:hypothetical protein
LKWHGRFNINPAPIPPGLTVQYREQNLRPVTGFLFLQIYQ